MHKNNGKSPESSVIHKAHTENRKAKRAEAYKRAQARKDANRERNEKARQRNNAGLAFLGLERTFTTVQRVIDGKVRNVKRPDSPQRTARLAGIAEADIKRYLSFN